MITLLWGLLGLLGLALLLVLVALATPVQIALSAEVGRASRFCLRLRLSGGVTPWIRAFDTARPGRAPAAAGEPEPRRPRSARTRGRKGSSGGWGLLEGRKRRLLRALPEFLRRQIRRIDIDRLSVEGDIGLGDPADTGRLFGYLMPLNHALRLPRTQIDLRPDFSHRRFEGRADAALHLVPLSVLVPVLQLGWRVYVARG